tara:strand:- start:33389 stop:34795 length:1407 start_codon:yes stop_codon:yes gene_type:complete
MLVFKRWLTEGIAQLSYLIGDDDTGTAAVIDPRPDCRIYVEYAREHGLAITHILETHIHADFMSGSRALAEHLGGVPVYVSAEDESDYSFDAEQLRDGDTFEFGSALLRVKATPGHTPEHVSFEICDAEEPDRPWGVFTGDSLFVDSAGRPDLLGDDKTEELVEQLYHTLQDYFMKLDDEVIIFPGHGKGSPCGPEIGERLSSSIRYERKSNRFLQFDDLDAFKESMLSDQPETPTHFPRMKKVNAKGPPTWRDLQPPRPLTPEQFNRRIEQGDAQLVDARHMLAFGGGHIDNAINLGADKAEMSIFAGWMLDPDRPILLVLDDDAALHKVVALLLRTGFTRHAGYLAGGMTAWNNAGLPIRHLRQLDAQRVDDAGKDMVRLDVRADDEWEDGHLPEAQHFFFGRFLDESPDLPKDKPVVTYCTTGYRANMAASILQKRGWEHVHSFPGSWKAWTSAGLPVDGGRKKK